jgi:hypothetical protein
MASRAEKQYPDGRDGRTPWSRPSKYLQVWMQRALTPDEEERGPMLFDCDMPDVIEGA